MAPYFEHMHRKSPHERRAHAMRVAGVITALIFAGWVSTIGLRAGTGAQVAQTADQSAQTAAALSAVAQGTGSAQLIVATSTE